MNTDFFLLVYCLLVELFHWVFIIYRPYFSLPRSILRFAMDLTTEILNKPDLSAVDLNKLKLVDLKKMCKAKGFSVAGSKNELISRLLQSLSKF